MARTAAALLQTAAINPIPNEFDDHFLDVVGNEFKFDHAKGLAEWIKNSADAYSTTARVRDGEQFIVLRFKQGKPKRESVFECIDFVGMTKNDIDKALKVWGLATAAARTLQKRRSRRPLMMKLNSRKVQFSFGLIGRASETRR